MDLLQFTQAKMLCMTQQVWHEVFYMGTKVELTLLMSSPEL